jgi:predicted DNA-binding helix-hairpin-helix protein
MLVHTQADTLTKLAQVGEAARFEVAADPPELEPRSDTTRPHSLATCITPVATPRGRLPVLKAMLTTACERNCYYCPFRAGRSRTKRITLRPDELAQGFERLHQTGQVEGLFLSSGIIKGSVTTQDKIIETAEILRRRYHYRGYLHLKLMPGVETEQLYRLMKLADRVSVNLEGPTPERVAALAPGKEFQRELLATLQTAEQIRRAHPEERLAGTVTQFVVGAVGDTDHELLSVTQRLYHEDGLIRAYYSGFSPLIQTPFENLPATDPAREHRLYQASFLLRDYGWRVEELIFGSEGNLPLDLDPKRAWAESHLRDAPLEIMRASREQLLRVPGLGPRAAGAILRARRLGRLTDLSDLRHLRIQAPERAAPYILLDGTRPVTQLRLFS